jgi:cytochrome c553
MRVRSWHGWSLGLVLLSLSSPSVRAADSAGLRFFEQKVRPVLVEHCYRCHSAETNKSKGGLRLDTRAALLKGGDSGPAIVPGRAADSLLLRAVGYAEEGLRMPPKGKLPAAVIADLSHWVDMGAPDPRDDSQQTGTQRKPLDVSAGKSFWAFQPPRPHPIPPVRDTAWPAGDVDRFLLAALETRGLRPAPDADRATLLRRVSFDLIGLPPSPDEIAAFEADHSPAAYDKVVDRLLASPHFGERFGRHWLDLVRYSESSGGGRSLLFPDAWRYRDYVIESFNTDRPFDQFVREQVAGDLLTIEAIADRRRQLTATAFWLLGPTNYERQDKDVLEMDVIDEQLDTLGRAFLGLTVGCARCHDHKFDPIPTSDYYALAGILHSTRSLVHDNVSRWTEQPLPLPVEEERAVQRHEAALTALRQKVQQARQRKANPTELKELETALKRLTETGPARPLLMAVQEAARVEDCQVCIRGNIHNRGEKVRRGFLQVASAGRQSNLPAHESGRRELADWLTSPDNPLTARVAVNRIWQHLFGAGLVRTVDNFGMAGEVPSHPELLDHLALRFRAGGWSVKALVRSLVLSRAYRMSSSGQAGAAIDPDNRLLWRANRRRLEAECLRDAMLSAAGRLDRRLGGPTVRKGTTSEYGYVFDGTRRSVYLPVFRNRLPDLFEVFDFADPNLVTGRRTVSTTAPQALYLLNSPFVMEQARHTARSLLSSPELDDAGRLDRLYRLTLGRLPAPAERAIVLTSVAGAEGEHRLAAWERVCHALFACLDFRHLN